MIEASSIGRKLESKAIEKKNDNCFHETNSIDKSVLCSAIKRFPFVRRIEGDSLHENEDDKKKHYGKGPCFFSILGKNDFSTSNKSDERTRHGT